MCKFGRGIIAYRADNGTFADNLFKAEVKSNEQSISYCGVGGHHQNSLAKNRICVLTQHVRAMLLHVKLCIHHNGP